MRAYQFENIQKLEGHHGEVWALAVSNTGKFVVTGSHDKSIRVWEKLDEPVRPSPLPSASLFRPTNPTPPSSSSKKSANASSKRSTSPGSPTR